MLSGRLVIAILCHHFCATPSGLMVKVWRLSPGVFTPGWVVGRFQRLAWVPWVDVFACLFLKGPYPPGDAQYKAMDGACFCSSLFTICTERSFWVPPPLEGDRGWVPRTHGSVQNYPFIALSVTASDFRRKAGIYETVTQGHRVSKGILSPGRGGRREKHLTQSRKDAKQRRKVA